MLQNGQFGQANMCLYVYMVDQDKKGNKEQPFELDFSKPVFKDE